MSYDGKTSLFSMEIESATSNCSPTNMFHSGICSNVGWWTLTSGLLAEIAEEWIS